jgi:two-component system LytT family response regulator
VSIRVVVADDEPLGIRGIVSRLAGRPDVSVVAQCGSGEEAIEAIRRHRPDLLFLDVQMPVTDGFAVMRALMPAERPHVIFVTAFDRHAIRAFELHAMDYLLKPIDGRRFEDALARALAILRSEHDRFVVKLRDRVVLVPKEEIDWLSAEGDYVRVHAGAESWLIRDTIGSVANELGSRQFLRIHRSTIVNLARIREVRPFDDGRGEVALHDGTRLPFGRTYRETIDRLVRR